MLAQSTTAKRRMARAPRILFVTDNAPYPPTSGGGQRGALLLRALRTVGDVDFVFVDRARAGHARRRLLREKCGMLAAVSPWADPTTLIGRLTFVIRANLDLAAPLLGGMRRAYSPEPRVQRWLNQLIKERGYDIIVGRYLRGTALSGALEHAPVLLDLDDYDVDFYASSLRATGVSRLERFKARRALAQIRDLVPCLLARCAHVWVTNAEDQGQVHGVATSILPNIPYTEGAAPDVSVPPAGAPILLVATTNYAPNARSVDHFVSAIWPRIRAACPAARVRIVGTGMSDRQRRRWGRSEGVDAVGPVEDLHAEYARAGFAIAPIFEGGGTKIKVLEALRHGRAVVVSRHAQRGFEHVLRDDESLAVAADEAAFATRCVELWNEPARAARLAERGAAIVAREFGWEHFRAIVADAVNGVLAASERGEEGSARDNAAVR